MERHCNGCGSPIRDGEVFCSECGCRITQYPQQPVQQAQADFQPQNYQYSPVIQQTPKTQKHGKASVITSIVLAAVLLVEGVIAGIWYPGFFNPVHEPQYTENGGQYGSESIMSMMNIDPGYTEEEIAAAPVTVMHLTREKPSVVQGSYAVDFGEYNLYKDDDFAVRELPARIYDDMGCAVKGYDFSLASGDSVFPTEIKITVPRDEADGDYVMFLSRDPQTNNREAVYFEISEDGKNYELYTTHFSGYDKLIVRMFGEELSKDIRSGDVSKASTREALGAFFYPSRVKWDQCMNTQVAYDSYSLWSKASKYTYIQGEDDLLDAFTAQVKASGTDSIDTGGALFSDLSSLQEKTDLILNINGSADGTASAMKAMQLSSLSPGLNEAVEGLNRFNTGNALPLTRIGAVSNIVGFVFLHNKISKEVADGKHANDNQAMWSHRAECASTLLGIISTGAGYLGIAAKGAAAGTALAAAGSGAAAAAAVCAIAGLGLYCYSKSCTTPYDDLKGAKQNYWEYYCNSTTGSRHFYYDMPEYEDHSAKAGAAGNIRRLTVLNDKQNELLKIEINEKMKRINGTGGIYADDTRSKSISLDWSYLVAAVFIVLKDEPEKIPEAIKEFYENYSKAAMYLGGSAFLKFSQDQMLARGDDPNSARLPEFDDKIKDKTPTFEMYAGQLQEELFAKHSGIFRMFTELSRHSAQLKVDNMIRTELLPLLNTTVEFNVRDETLENPDEFAYSVYNQPLADTGKKELYYISGVGYSDYSQNYLSSMEFCTRDKNGKYERLPGPVFIPSVNYSDQTVVHGGQYYGANILPGFYENYYPVKDNFYPMLIDGKGSTVFRCTYYHYLMMGAPKEMILRTIGNDSVKEKTVDFEVPNADADGVIRVLVRVTGNNSLDPFLGKWEGTQEMYPRDAIEYRDWEKQNIATKPWKVRLELSIAEEGKLDVKVYYNDKLYDAVSRKLEQADNYGYTLEDSVLYLYKGKPTDIPGIPFSFGFRLTVNGGSMSFSTIETRGWEEGSFPSWTEYTQSYINTCTLNKVG